MVFGIAYYIGYVHARILKKLIDEYDIQIAGTDWDYFGCKIENKFGMRNWKYYAFLPFIKPTIAIQAQYKPK